MTRQVYIYGLGGADKMYRVLAYHFITEEDITINNLVYWASMLRLHNPVWSRCTRLIIITDFGIIVGQACTEVQSKTALFSRTFWKHRAFDFRIERAAEKSVALSFYEVLIWKTNCAHGKSLSTMEKSCLPIRYSAKARMKRRQRLRY